MGISRGLFPNLDFRLHLNFQGHCGLTHVEDLKVAHFEDLEWSWWWGVEGNFVDLYIKGTSCIPRLRGNQLNEWRGQGDLLHLIFWADDVENFSHKGARMGS